MRSADTTLLPSDFESRFREPPGWRWGSFKTSDGAVIRFGSLSPKEPVAIVVILPGRSEFIEKYFETVKNLEAQNLTVWIMEWRGQGKSGRVLPDKPHRCHAPPFGIYAGDLKAFISGYVKPTASDTPLIMLAHSMGAHIGLLHLYKYPDVFKAAALSAPMLGLKFKNLPGICILAIAWFFNSLCPEAYAFGQGGWNKEQRLQAADALTSDPARGAVHDTWMEADPELRMRGVTFGWVYRALSSCWKLRRRQVLKSIRTPCLIVLPGEERLVDDRAARRAATILPRAKVLEIPEAGHEILMERDRPRTLFLEAFYRMIDETLRG